MSNIVYKEESYKIVGACMHVHNELGSGFRENVYQEALQKEFIERKIEHTRHKKLQIKYKEEVLSKYFISDFLCFDKIVLEVKAAEYVIKEHEKQLLNYLKATEYKLGILVNFGQPSLYFKRFVL